MLQAQPWPPSGSRGRGTAPRTASEPLERQCSSLPPGRAGEDLELAEQSDGTTSDEAPAGAQTRKTLPRERRSRYRLRKFVDAAMSAEGQSFLEKNTVDKKSRARYDSSLRNFLAFAEEEKLPLKTSADDGKRQRPLLR